MSKFIVGSNACKLIGSLFVVALLGSPGLVVAKDDKANANSSKGRMSSPGQTAARVAAVLRAGGSVADALARGACLNEPECEDDASSAAPIPQDDSIVVAPGGQAETSIAVDATGQHIVIGFNDTRGFARNPISVSGFMYSDDGGRTFVDGGQLPSPGVDVIGTTRFPQVFGDPEIKYLGGCNFIYASILVKKFSATRSVQTMGIHRSTDCGHTWSGPFEVTAATNPNGGLTLSGTPRDAADKEFMDVDPDTGRVMMSWSNFTPFALGGVEIATTYSDNILTATPPTWSTRKIVAAGDADGQGSVPRFAGNGSSNAYVAWARFPFPGSFFGFGNSVAFARSTDNGATWSAPMELSAEFFTMDQVLGNDRVNTFPTLAVDTSSGPNKGAVYVAYANNDSGDGADIVFQKSTDGGLTFSAPLRLNSRPGADRAQWVPWLSVDRHSGRVYVMHYDQGIAATGDLTQLSYMYSDDGGTSWKQSRPLTARPFHAGWGNDTGQPNLGDYIQAVAQGGELFAAYAVTARPPLGFADGQPSTSMTVPDVEFVRKAAAEHKFKATTLDLQGVSFIDSGKNGFIDPNETVELSVTLRNYVTNVLNADKVRGAQITLTTPTAGVVVDSDHAPLPTLNAGETSQLKKGLVIRTLPSFVAGTPIELVFAVSSAEHADVMLHHTLFTGTPIATPILAENFNGVASGSVPAGWARVHAGGANTVPWTTSSTFCGATSNAAFHQNANDGVGGTGNPTRFERLFSPAFTIPANSEYVTVEMDICYDTEDDPNFNILGYDGFLLRVTDLTAGRTVRSVLVEAMQDEFTTGDAFHYPKHFPRGSSAAYFEDMSAWSGYSNGWKHVRMRLPGMASSTAQLRFEFTQDGFGTCADVRPGHACGVAVDNIVIKSFTSAPSQP